MTERITDKIKNAVNHTLRGLGLQQKVDKQSMDWAIGLPIEAEGVVDADNKTMYVVGDKQMTWEEMGEINQRRFKDSVISKIK